MFGVRPMIRRIFSTPEVEAKKAEAAAIAAVVAAGGAGGLVLGPGGAITVTNVPGAPGAAAAAAAAAGAVPGQAGLNVSGGSGGSITRTGGPNVNLVGGDASVAISNRTSAMIDIAQVQGQVHAQSVQKVGELAEKNPHEAVSIIRSWLHEEAA